jgi:AcrR family transcriptional regulator
MAGNQRGRRATLSREIILDAAFRVVDADEMNELTMSRLGRELDADPSAVYRHFRNKDELLLAMADVQMEEVVRTYEPGDDPYANLRHMLWVLRRSYLSRPGLARAVAPRFTGGAAETVLVRQMIENVASLGYDEAAAIARVRAVAEMTLGHIIMTAEVVSLPRRAQAFELEMARSYYTFPKQPLSPAPLEEQRAANRADGDEVYSTMLEIFLAGLAADAPQPSARSKAPTKAASARSNRA